MGRVWLARDEVLHRDVAIKEVIPPAGLTEAEREEMRQRTLREARAAARLNHPSVVRVYDVVRTDVHPWIVMEYVPARSLHEIVAEDGVLPWARVAQIGLQVLGALRAAHRAGVLHRDVKPSNVLLTDDGRVVLTDFGLATMPGEATVTRPGMVLGSPAYISPERAREGIAGPESDLWSLGATLYAAVEGNSPYQRSSAIATLTALVTEEPPPARHAGALRPLLNGLLRKDPRTRIDAEEAERLLRRAAGGGLASRLWLVPKPRIGPSRTSGAAPSTPVPPPSGAPGSVPGTRVTGRAAAGGALGRRPAAGASPARGATPAGGAVPGATSAGGAGSARGVAPGATASAGAAAGPAGVGAAVARARATGPGVVAARSSDATSVSDAPQPDAVDASAAGSAHSVLDLDDKSDGANAVAQTADGTGGDDAGADDAGAVDADGAGPGTATDDDGGLADTRADLGGTGQQPGPVRTGKAVSPGGKRNRGGKASRRGKPPRRFAADKPHASPAADKPAAGVEATAVVTRKPDRDATTVIKQRRGGDRTTRIDRPVAPPKTRPDGAEKVTRPAPVALPAAATVLARRVRELPHRARELPHHVRELPQRVRTLPRSWLLAAGFVLVTAVVLTFALLPGADRDNTAAPAPGPSSAAPAAPAVPSQAPTSNEPVPTPTATTPPAPALPAGWSMYTDPSGFSVARPDGWNMSQDGSILYFREPNGGRVLGIDQSSTPNMDPVGDWTKQRNARVAGGDFPGYQEIGIRAVNYWQACADWEFTYDRGGGRTHAVNRGFVTSDHQAYGIWWSTPDSAWQDNLKNWEAITTTFKPKP